LSSALGQSFVYVTFYNNKRAVFLAIFRPQTHMTFAKKWLKKQHPCCCSDVRYTVLVHVLYVQYVYKNRPPGPSFVQYAEFRGISSLLIDQEDKLSSQDKTYCREPRTLTPTLHLRRTGKNFSKNLQKNQKLTNRGISMYWKSTLATVKQIGLILPIRL
jgi:hypothetical protein